MFVTEQTVSKPYANDRDYDAFRGRVTYRGSVVGITLDGWKVRRTVTYIDVGRADAIIPRTGEELMEAERMPGDLRGAPQTNASRIAAGKARRKAKRDCIIKLLRERGPLTCDEIAEELGYVAKTTREILEASRGASFDKVGGVRVAGRRGGVPVPLWGLKGIHDTRKDTA